MKYTAILCGLIAGTIGAQASLTSPVLSSVDELVMVTIDGDINSVGSTNNGLSGTFDFAVRERRSAGQTSQRVVSYVKFDVNGLTVADVSDPGFSSTLTLDYTDRLNELNVASVRVDQVAAANTWSDASGSYPLASWYDNSTDLSSSGLEVIADLKTQNPADATDEVVLDVTSWVQDWVNGTAANNGLAFFIPKLEAQAAGFTVTSLQSIPEPATLGLLTAFGGGILFIRRRFMI